jgi:hypothetical protein
LNLRNASSDTEAAALVRALVCGGTNFALAGWTAPSGNAYLPPQPRFSAKR